MNRRTTRPTSRQFERLMQDSIGAPGRPLGDCLTDDQFVAYSMDPPELSDDVMARLDAHLGSCDSCAARMEHLLDVSETWRGPAGAGRLVALAERLRNSFVASAPAVVRLREWLSRLQLPPAGLVAVADDPVAVQAESPTGLDHVSIRDDAERNLLVGVSSYDLELEGARIVIEPFDAALVLKKGAPDQLGAELVIPRARREGLPPGDTVRLRVDVPATADRE